MRVSLVILAALAAASHAADVTTKAKVDAKEITYSTDPHTGHTIACDDYGCKVVSTGTSDAPVDDHYKLAHAAVNSHEVMVCTDDGCFLTDASKVDPDKVNAVCDDEKCVLVPKGDTDPNFCRSDGICYSCDINAAHLAKEHNLD